MKTERLTLEKLASCMAAPIPTIPEHVLQVSQSGLKRHTDGQLILIANQCNTKDQDSALKALKCYYS